MKVGDHLWGLTLRFQLHQRGATGTVSESANFATSAEMKGYAGKQTLHSVVLKVSARALHSCTICSHRRFARPPHLRLHRHGCSTIPRAVKI